jgi:hypothetical protein
MRRSVRANTGGSALLFAAKPAAPRVNPSIGAYLWAIGSFLGSPDPERTRIWLRGFIQAAMS